RLNYDHHQLMDEVAMLINTVANKIIPEQRLSYAELFYHYLQLDPHVSEVGVLRARAIELGVRRKDDEDIGNREAWLDFLLAHVIAPQLPPQQMIFVYDYPQYQAIMAQLRPGNPPVAERFELYLGGMELANGYHELRNAKEQSARLQADMHLRVAREQPIYYVDNRFLEALEAGLPDCSGVALGIDRLLMWLTGTKHIEQVLAFPL
ncbi:hypothetical protein TI03_02960, partial [Achromatium sp. WMS1]